MFNVARLKVYLMLTSTFFLKDKLKSMSMTSELL